MNTRCKPGDLAVITNATKLKSLIGRIVMVDRPFVGGEIVGGVVFQSPIASDGHFWVVKPVNGTLTVEDTFGGRRELKERTVPDKFLRPIRPNEGEDESLSWAEKPPSKIKQPA